MGSGQDQLLGCTWQLPAVKHLMDLSSSSTPSVFPCVPKLPFKGRKGWEEGRGSMCVWWGWALGGGEA